MTTAVDMLVERIDCAPMSELPIAWTFDENKQFEVLLAKHYQDGDSRWVKVAGSLPNRTVQDLQQRFQQLEDDLKKITDGKVRLPQYSPDMSDDAGPSKKNKLEAAANGERRKGVPWTEEEHRLFLLGLNKHGKGDWRSIARNYVVSRTPTQVASHAQKYFIRLNTMTKKDKRRASIHDITSAGGVMGHQAGQQVGQGGGPAGGTGAGVGPHAGGGTTGAKGNAGGGGGARLKGANGGGNNGNGGSNIQTLGGGGGSGTLGGGMANTSMAPMGQQQQQPLMMMPMPYGMPMQMPRVGSSHYMPHM